MMVTVLLLARAAACLGAVSLPARHAARGGAAAGFSSLRAGLAQRDTGDRLAAERIVVEKGEAGEGRPGTGRAARPAPASP